MPRKAVENDGPRALLTAREREIVSGGADDVSDSYRYQTISRVRRRITENLEDDMAAFDAHGELAEDVRDIVCGDEGEGEGQ